MKETCTRRRWLSAVAGSAPLLAGCTSDSGGNDADGDGVVDAEDYAPNDPDVQAKSDLKSAAPTVSPSATPTPSPSPTSTATRTPTAVPSATDRAEADRHTVDGSAVAERTYVSTYSGSHATVQVRSHPAIELDRAKVLSIAYGFPRGEAVAYGTSEPFSPPGDGETVEISVDYDTGSAPTETRLHHLVFAMPADMSVEEAGTSDLWFIYETDPFQITDGRTVPDEPEYFPSDDDTDAFTRESRPGHFRLQFDGTTKGKDWAIDFVIWKSAYATAHDKPRGRSYSEYVSLASNNGIAGELAQLLNTDSEANDFTGKREKVELVIDFVQSLPYVTDNVSSGYDDYPKLVEETAVEAEGDCEDTAILLAAVLQAEPFGYDMVLIQPPEHMAVGIYGKDLPGSYWEYDGRDYYYIETTGESWGIGDLPESYQGTDARVHQV